MKMLLHACCGPCSLEPVRLLRERGFDITIAFANSNIAPRTEYDKRLTTLRAFADEQGIAVIEASYNADAWERCAGSLGDSLAQYRDLESAVERAQSVSELLDDEHRVERCRACYRMRLEEAAHLAKEGGFDTLATTLAVSPYQFTDVIREELERAASANNLDTFFEDWRPYYDNALIRSRDTGMYRQSYCGCRFSVAEGVATRAFAKRQIRERKAAKRAEHAQEIAQNEAAAALRAKEKSAYQSKQARKHAILKQLRAQRKQEEES